MKRQTFIAVCQFTELDANGHPGERTMALKVYDTYGNCAGMAHLLPECNHDQLVYGNAEDLVDIAYEVAPRVIDDAIDLTVRGQAFDIEDWRKRRTAALTF